MVELELLSNKRLEEQQEECRNRTNNLDLFQEQLAPLSSNNLAHLPGQLSNPHSSSSNLEEVSLAHSNSNSLDNNSLEDKDNSSREVDLTGAVALVELQALLADFHRVEVPVL